ncbi:MAG: response regulator [Planctomycetaceae bacterium]|nr:response regulator [Planctomycetaceae bacterium]
MAELESILHVDDDEDILELTRMSLEIVGGYEVHQFSSAKEALESFERLQPDLLLLDVMMPDADGPTLLSRIKGLPGYRGTPAVFMTAKAEAAENSALKATGALGVITKPFDPMQLPEKLARLWKGRMSDPSCV